MSGLLWAAVCGAAALLSSLFAAAETAFFALNRDRVEALRRRHRAGAAVEALWNRPHRLLAITWSGRIVAGAGAAATLLLAVGGVPAPGQLAGPFAGLVLLLIALEIAGRGWGLRHAEALSLRLAAPLRWVARLLFPLWAPLEFWIVRWVERGGEFYPRITDREIRSLLAHKETAIEEHERRLIERVFTLDRTRAYDVMTPRVDIFAWPAAGTVAQIAPQLRTARYSRVPVYGENLDDISGILHARDAYQALISGQRDLPLHDLAREPFFVPGSIPLNRLLVDFQTRRIHLGIVIDEYGGTDGLITLEDILEELVGEIADERETREEAIVRVARNEVLVDGSAELREINHFLNTSLPQLEHRSLNGYLLEEMGRVPRVGEKLEREGVQIEVIEASDTQVVRARITRVGVKGDSRESAPGPVPPDAKPLRPDEGTRIVP
jgi:CBS domain containing-hemolysin-like protein